MKINSLPIVISLFSTLNWTTTVIAQNSIRFEGSIVERGCHSSVDPHGVLELKTCPALARETTFDVVHLAQPRTSPNITVKRLTDSGQGRYYDQKFTLVDTKGKPILSGNYLITMALP